MRLQGIFYARFYFKTLAYESKGRRFESCRGHHRNADTAKNCGVFLFSGEQMSIWYGEYLGKNLITINNKQDLFL